MQLSGGIGLFLLGMTLMTDSLKAMAGDSLRLWLGRFTGSPIKAMFSGIGFTMLVQSSTATTLATIGFVSAGVLTFAQAIGIIIGANIGTTSTGWMVAFLGLKFSITAFALPMVGVGAMMKLLGKELVAYWQKVEAVDGRQGTSLNLAIQHQRELELKLEQTKMKEIIQRTQLKILAGVEPQQRLEVDTKSADSVLAGFDGHKLTWEDRWPATEDELLLRGQVKLSDYNIMVAWAQYMPSMSIAVNNSPPAGQYQPTNGKEDTFLHLTFDFPLIDWGRRYRGVQTARMNKAQAFHELARKRTDYSNKWLQCEQRVALAETERKLAKTRLDTASMQFKEAQISFQEGIVQLPDVATKQEDMVQARIAFISADLDYKLAMLEWMDLSNSLAQRFLGLPAKEVL